jgi:hypothetical protein
VLWGSLSVKASGKHVDKIDSWNQFYQHFTSSFFANFLSLKKYKLIQKTPKHFSKRKLHLKGGEIETLSKCYKRSIVILILK